MRRLPGLRRVTAVLAVLLTIVLVIGSGAACPMWGATVAGAHCRGDVGAAHRAAGGNTLASAMSMASGHARHHGSRPAGPDCAAPCVPSACATGVQCTSPSATPPATALQVLGAAGAVHARIHSRAPRSVSIAPEPPPPRA
ncbi:MAG TPA: hypothetical protein VF041_05595 [Gemmatimonadaceae bacterium]